MDARLTAGQDNEFWAGGGSLIGQLAGRSLADLFGDELRVPGGRGVTPGALHRATLESDEEGLTTEMDAFPLPTEERLIDGVELSHGQAFGW
jgi:hypothetical protein